MNSTPDIALFFGRFHPVFLHLPIGFLVALAGLELLGWLPGFKGAAEARRPILLLLAPAAVITAVCGWLLSRGGGYDAELVRLHLWTGIGVAVVSVLLYWVQGAGRLVVYRLGLLVALGLMAVTSHLGGTLTHGKGYLTRHAPEPLRAWLGSAGAKLVSGGAAGVSDDAVVYEAYVRPILERTCVSCHGPEKSKAGLRCDTVAAMREGGDTGPAITAGKAAESLLIQRILLPLEDDEHMPPDGKPQPTPDELAVLRWWIDSGAPEAAKLSELRLTAEVRAILGKLSAEATGP